MAGIFGAWNADGRPVERSTAVRMSEALAHRGPGNGRVHVSASFAIGCRSLPLPLESTTSAQPVRLPSGAWLVFDGRLDNRTELIASLAPTAGVDAATEDAWIAGWCYETHGADFVARLAGDFALAVINPATATVLLARDVIGIRPLYFTRSGASIAFASEIKALMTVPAFRARPNDRLLAELMLRRLHRRDHDGSTLFDGVHAVPPAHVITFTPERTHTRRYWNFNAAPPASRMTFDACVEGFRDHFERAVARRLRGTRPAAIAVSGGLDSSAIFGVAHRVAPGRTPLGFTYATTAGSPADESAYLAELEREYGTAIAAVDADARGRDGLVSSAAELIRRVEAPMANAQWRRADSLVAAARAAGAHSLVTGHWGDQILFDQAYLIDLLHRGSIGTIRSHLRTYGEWFPDAPGHTFTARFFSDLLEYELSPWARTGIRAVRGATAAPAAWDDWYTPWFREQAGPDVFAREAGTTAQARALYREVRSRYHDLCLVWHNTMAAAHGVERSFPFLDRDLVQFVMDVPGDILARDGVPKALLRTSLEGIVPASVLQRRTKGDFTAAVNSASRDDHTAIARVLSADALVVQLGYVEADKLIKGLRAVAPAMEQSSSCTASWRLTALLALELWLREFAGGHQRRESEHAEAITFC
jgi:asparagine synthase (glutamine-hydrolysing)